MSVHIELDELADAAAGALDAQRRGAIDSHVHSCTQCRHNWSALADVSRTLAAEPAPAMPPDVTARLNEVVRAESARRARVPAEFVPASAWARPTLGPFAADPGQGWHQNRRRNKMAASVLAACAAAGLVGFGGYVLSASVGLNEPTATSPAQISSSELGREAQVLERSSDLDPHRFSKAWRCARQVTPGRITGLTPATVDGQPALLVYAKTKDATVVSVVTGCSTGAPSVGPSTTVPR